MSRRALRLGYFIRGRRRIGKSALVEAFIDRHHVPNVFYTAEIGFGGRPQGTGPRRSDSSRGGLVAAQQSHQEWASAAGLITAMFRRCVIRGRFRTI